MPHTVSSGVSLPGPHAPVELGIDPATLGVLQNARDAYGPIVRFHDRSGAVAVFVNSPPHVRQILVQNHGQYAKGPGFERVKMLLGNGIIVSDGEQWRRHRRMIQPAFSRRHLHDSVAMMSSVSRRLAERWAAMADSPEPLDITRTTSEFALEVILRAIFGDDYDGSVVADGVNSFAFLSDDPTRDLRVVARLRGLRTLVQGLIDARRAASRTDGDFLAALIDARDKDGAGFNDAEIIDEVMTLVVAGYETAAGTLNWAWYKLARHPDAQSSLATEVAALAKSGRGFTAEDLQSLSFTQQLLSETLRLYPPVWLFTRRSVEDDSLDGAGVVAGTAVYVSPYILHRSEEYWPDANRFLPERFAAGVRQYDSTGVYCPFSLGPRRCIGEYFALLEMQMHLATLASAFRVEVPDDSDPGLDLGINLRSGRSIHLNIRAR